MGKVEEEQSLPSTVATQNAVGNAENRCVLRGFIRFRCVLALLMGIAVLLSAIFWLPPFLQYRDQRDLDLDSQFKDHDIVARFMVKQPVSLLEDNILQLEDDIFDEMSVPNTKVDILSLEPSAGLNTTKVVFAVDPHLKNSKISSTSESLVRSSFELLVIGQQSLRLTASLFENPFAFEVLKFPGGITITPPQSAFLLQKVQIFFNFTLNFSISQIQDNFNELTSQLKSGLHLAPYENLYIWLTNSKGSTVAPPTTVQTSVLLAVRDTPSMSRIRQLAQTITGSHSKNLGLNNTVFGRVKQVRLSSVLQHSLGGGSPTPAPMPHPHHHPSHHRHRHHHHHRHHRHRHHDAYLAPAITPGPATEKGSPTSAPALAPEPWVSHEAKPPGCHFEYREKFPRWPKRHFHAIPPVASPFSPHHTSPSPHQPVKPPAPAFHLIPASSPVPNLVFTRVQPPSKGDFDAEPPDIAPSVSPLPSSSSAGCFPSALWAILLFPALVLYL